MGVRRVPGRGVAAWLACSCATAHSVAAGVAVAGALVMLARSGGRADRVDGLGMGGLSALWQRESLFDEQGLLRVRGMIAEG